MLFGLYYSTYDLFYYIFDYFYEGSLIWDDCFRSY